MIIVSKAYDDYSAEVIDTNNGFKTVYKTEEELVRACAEEKVYGIYTADNEIQYFVQYDCRIYNEEDLEEEYSEGKEFSKAEIIEQEGFKIILEERDEPLHKMEYCVFYVSGEEITYIGNKCKYTRALNAAKRYNKFTAKEIADKMAKRSKTGKHWTSGKASLMI